MPTDPLPSHKSTSGSLGWGGVGWGGIITSLAFPHDLDATLYDLNWHFHMNLMLRSMIFNWHFQKINEGPRRCDIYKYLSYLCQRTRYRRTNPHPVAWGGVGWGGIITSLAFPHDLDATLYDLNWHFHMNLMLRSMTFNWHFHMILMLRSMIFNWHFHMILMLRSMIFIGIST